MAESAQPPPPKKVKRKGKANSFDGKWIEHFNGIGKSIKVGSIQSSGCYDATTVAKVSLFST